MAIGSSLGTGGGGGGGGSSESPFILGDSSTAAMNANVAAFNALAAEGYVPPVQGDVYFNGTLWVPGPSSNIGVAVTGFGRDVTRYRWGGSFAGPAMVAGVPARTVGALDAVPFSLNSVLDSSAQGKVGLVLTGGLHLAFIGSSVARWNWASAPGLSVRIKLVGACPPGPISGCTDGGTRHSPYTIESYGTGGSAVIFARVATAAGNTYVEVPRVDDQEIWLTHNVASGVTALRRRDGTAIVTATGTPGSPLVRSDPHLALLIAATGSQPNFLGTGTVRLAGHRVGADASTTPGNDAAHYFTMDGSTVHLLPLDQTAAEVKLGSIRGLNPYSTEYGLIPENGWLHDSSSRNGPHLRGLRLELPTGYGACLMLGWAKDTLMEDVGLVGGSYGLVCPNWGTAYTTRWRGGYCSGHQLGNAYLWKNTTHIEHVDHYTAPLGEAVVTNLNGKLFLRNNFFSNASSPSQGGPSALAKNIGGGLELRCCNSDIELDADATSLVAAVWTTFDNNAWGQNGDPGYVLAEDCNIGRTGAAAAPVYKFDGVVPSGARGFAKISFPTQVFDSDGPLVHAPVGIVRGGGDTPGPVCDGVIEAYRCPIDPLSATTVGTWNVLT